MDEDRLYQILIHSISTICNSYQISPFWSSTLNTVELANLRKTFHGFYQQAYRLGLSSESIASAFALTICKHPSLLKPPDIQRRKLGVLALGVYLVTLSRVRFLKNPR